MGKGCAKGSRRGLNPDELIEVALKDGLSQDKSGIDSNPVHRKLNERNSQLQYNTMWDLWEAYERKYPGSDLRNMEDMKHIAEAVGRSTSGRLDKETRRATVKTVRNKMRKLMSIWQRRTNFIIPPKVHDSVAPYIKDVLRYKIPLSIEEKEPTFLTIENYVDMEELLWQHDYHNYVHEGCRVDLSTLLKMHCYTSARLQEICKAKYKDLICMVGWKDSEPEIKISFKREFAKAMQDTTKKPKHPLYERLNPAPPLFANGLLFLLSIIISARAFKDYSTIEDVFAARPLPGRKYLIMDWIDSALDDPVFPEVSVDGPTKKAKNETAWGNQCSMWAKRAGFIRGMGLHAARREALIKVDDGGYSLGQVMKFAAHRNSKTLVGHYLCDTSNVDGAASFLNLEPRRDLTEDFRSASMKRNVELWHSLPAKFMDELRQRQDFIKLDEQVDNLSAQIMAAITESCRQELTAKRRHIYDKRRKLIDGELANYRRTTGQAHIAQCKLDDQGEWRRSYFDRVVRHMVPERDRLACTLPLAVPLRSVEGISALQDLISLRTKDSHVAYQKDFQPIEGCCIHCSQNITRIALKDRWKHMYQCSRDYHVKKFGLAEYCFQCSVWVTSNWEAHCQGHIDKLDLPYRCNLVIFRRAIACAGHCIVCLGEKSLPATKRMKQYLDATPWRKHISQCIPVYIKSLHAKGLFRCPHPLCVAKFQSELDLWHHLDDFHSTSRPAGKKRQCREDKSVNTLDAVTRKRPRLQQRGSKAALGQKSRYNLSRNFVSISAINFANSPDKGIGLDSSSEEDIGFSHSLAEEIKEREVSSCSSSGCSALDDSVWDEYDGYRDTDTSFSSPTYTPAIGTLIKERSHPPSATPMEYRASSSALQDDGTVSSQTPFTNNIPSCASTVNTEFIDPQLLYPSSTLAPCGEESTMDQLFSSDQEIREKPVAINEKKKIWEVEALLAKSKEGRTTWYLVKWKGFPDKDNSWVKRGDISRDLVYSFERGYQGNNLGVRLIDKREQKSKVEYLVQWKGRPEEERSWVNEDTISRERIMEFEAR